MLLFFGVAVNKYMSHCAQVLTTCPSFCKKQWKSSSTLEETLSNLMAIYSTKKMPFWLFSAARTEQRAKYPAPEDLTAHFQAPVAHVSSMSLGPTEEPVKLQAVLLLWHRLVFHQPAALNQRRFGCVQQFLWAPSFINCHPDQYKCFQTDRPLEDTSLSFYSMA